MPQFHYYAIDDQGQPQTGDLDAADSVAARRQLEERGWHVGSIESVAEQSPAGRLSSEEESQAGGVELWKLKRRRNGLRDQLRATLTYPLLLVVLLFIVSAFILLSVVPAFVTIPDGAQLPLPLMTMFILCLAEPGIHGFLIIVGIFATMLLMATIVAWRRQWHAARQLEQRGRPAGSVEFVAEALGAGRLTSEEESQFGIHLAEAVGAELPLPECLRAIADEVGKGKIACALRRVADGVASGRSLLDSLNECGTGLPAHLHGLIAAGLRSGRLDNALAEFMELKRRGNQMRYQLRATLTYPAVLFVLLFGVSAFVLLTIVPTFTKIYGEFRMGLPIMTNITIWLAGPGIQGFVIVVGVLAALLLIATLVGGRLPWHTVRRALPIVGPVYYCHSLSDFSQLLSVLLIQGIPLPEALRLTGRGVSDAIVGPTTSRLANAVAQGETLASALCSGWPRPLAALEPIVRWGERHNSLPEALQASAVIYADLADAQLDLVQLIVPPLVFLFISVGSAFLIVSLVIPLVSW
ncbi:MAG: type II secretion system F family protein [Planctomycetia bacterium]|nr:type II secretion system F family protein [Planctomycetia bacterium]